MKVIIAAACLGATGLIIVGSSAVTVAPASMTHAAPPAWTALTSVGVSPTPTPSALATSQAAGPASRAATGSLPNIETWRSVPGKQFHPPGGMSPNSPLFRGGRARSAAAPSAVANAPAPRTTRTPALTPVVFGGLNKPGIAVSDDPGLETPPDSTGAIGPNHYVEIANSVIHVWDRSLNSVTSMQLWSFIGAANSMYPLCDVQVQWDQTAGRWLMSFLFCNISSSSQGFYVAWSNTSDPSDLVNGWCIQGVQTSPYLLDFPKLGHNSNYVIVGGNLYDETNPSPNPPFKTAAMIWAALPAPGASCGPTTFFGTSPTTPLKNGDGTTDAFTPIPVNTTSGAADGYVVAAYDAGANVTATPTPQSKLAVWHLDSSGVLHQDSDIPVATYALPPPAAQMGSTNKIDTLDTRLTQAVGDPVTGIWTQHTVSGGTTSKVTWYELGLSGSALALMQSGDVASATDFIFNAAISPNSGLGGAAIFYNKSSSTTLPSIAAQARLNSTPAGAMEPGELSLATSGGADTETLSCNKPPGAPCRWGDYSGASPDPVNPYLVWGTNEVNLAAGSSPAWRDENFAVGVFPPPAAPTGVMASSGDDGFSCVSWTAPAANPPVTGYTITAYQGATAVKTVTVPAAPLYGCVNGLTDGVPYTFTVLASNLGGPGPESAHSAQATPSRGAAPSTPGTAPTRPPVNQAPTPPPPPPR